MSVDRWGIGRRTTGPNFPWTKLVRLQKGCLYEATTSLPLSLGLEFFAMDFLSLMELDCLSFLGRILAAEAGSTGLMSELEAIEA